MKYSEFKQVVEELGYTFFENKYEVRILDKGACKLIIIDKTDTHVIDPNNVSYITLSHKDKTELLDLACELAKTPLAEREEEKRYWLQKIPVPLLDKGTEKKWLWKYTGTKNFNSFGADITRRNSGIYKTIFTESEIAEMDITGFKKIEVMDGE